MWLHLRDELAGNVRVRVVAFNAAPQGKGDKRRSCKEKPTAKGHRPPSPPESGWAGVSRGHGHPSSPGSAEEKPSFCQRAAGVGSAAALLRPGWAADEDFPGAEKIKLTFLWDDQSPRACCLRGAC